MAFPLPPTDLTLDQIRQSTTVLYVTVTHTLRGDIDKYMFSIDHCYTNVEQANERVELLGRCNVKQNKISKETKEIGKVSLVIIATIRGNANGTFRRTRSTVANGSVGRATVQRSSASMLKSRG